MPNRLVPITSITLRAEMVAELRRAAAVPKWKQIGVDDPLDLLGAGTVAGADRRQRDVEHGAVDEGQARGEDAASECPARVRAAGSGPFVAVAWAQSTCCAIAASTMALHVSGFPAAAMASSGSRAV